MEDPKNQRIFRMQPILCPWITSQPYHSSLWSKNRPSNQHDPSLTNRFLNNPWINRHMPVGMPRSHDKPSPSIQQSSSQFFYFLRLMQLFPDTHPATLHTVLVLCKNDFFCAVDKMLYAKRCKLLCHKKNLLQKAQQHRKSDSAGEAKSKNEYQRLSIQGNKGHLQNIVTGDKKKNEPGLIVNLQKESSGETFIVNSFTETAEDLSTVKKCLSEDVPHI